MNIIDIIIKKRLKYEQRLGSILYRLLAPIKLLIIVGITVLILRVQFSGNLLENPTAINILTIMIIVGIIYSFDFLYVIAYVIAKKSSKSQIIETKYKREMGKSIRKMGISKRKMGKYKQEMEESKQELEQIELIKEKELRNELEQIPKLIEEKQYLIVKDKLEKILHESKQFHLNTIQTNAQAEYKKYKKFWE